MHIPAPNRAKILKPAPESPRIDHYTLKKLVE